MVERRFLNYYDETGWGRTFLAERTFGGGWTYHTTWDAGARNSATLAVAATLACQELGADELVIVSHSKSDLQSLYWRKDET